MDNKIVQQHGENAVAEKKPAPMTIAEQLAEGAKLAAKHNASLPDTQERAGKECR